MAGSKAITPGCLVLITGAAFKDSPNVGKMGKVLFQANEEIVYHGRTFHPRAYGCWVVEGEGIMCHVTSGSGDVWRPDGFCTSHEKFLLRIDPEADPLDVTHDEPLEFKV
ncbi:hypothetical protein FDJ32_gp06 [Pseudomonas phage NV1]|uniref:Uncharacterized protein n=1 Tax=Pseudomonas phage NV1 TaxID=2079543 RepID=A0A2L0HPM2_9CAUD|nr:hypothetical protein FDJ32_gp06 [Pseudomonas phage NV1]AUX83635.1 hypothetical protein NV1_p06 [Pseudomonas phage NV1]